jgi:S-DNA-T family DNA segregation ATPase FtsK/SpoIIIE
MAGAEKLLGLGDLLFLSAQIVKPKRIQGAYVSERELRKVIKWISENNENLLEEDELSEELKAALEKDVETPTIGPLGVSEAIVEDSLYPEAERTVIETRRASASFLQRKLRVGYARAARLLDMLEKRGVVGPPRGSKPREIYIGKERTEEDDFGNDYDEDVA